jgi:F420-0:gamma-glutamyl ligase-like protein
MKKGGASREFRELIARPVDRQNAGHPGLSRRGMFRAGVGRQAKDADILVASETVISLSQGSVMLRSYEY